MAVVFEKVNYSAGVMVDTPAIVAARTAGASYPELQSRFGCSAGQLKTILRKHNLHGSPMVRARVPADVQVHMCTLSDSGMSQAVIARETGWSRGSVARALDRRERHE